MPVRGVALRRWRGDLTHPPVLVGEDNPHGGRPGNALYPAPIGSAGHRLCVKIFNMDPRQYLLAFLRYNLCTGRWNRTEADQRARGIGLLYAENPIILLGSKVSTAFGISHVPFRTTMVVTSWGFLRRVLMLPHPSGQCRVWNNPRSFQMARDALEEVIRL